ncbi:MAG: efflux RND transporter periplasmic adaptor subunit [Candidatus Paceibacterota bacterium]|jgi:HlyD family secretion protein
MKPKHKWLVIAVVIVAAIAGWFLWPHPAVVPIAADTAALTVTVTHPKQQSLSETLVLSGVVVPREEIIITSELANVRVATVTAEEGMTVSKGQRLATFDASSFSHQLAQLEAAYTQAKGEFDRVEGIKDSGAVSQELYQQKRGAFLAAKARRDDAALSVKRGDAVSPAAGFIYERQARIGALVSESTPLFRIALDGIMELEATVAETDLNRLRIGQKMAVNIAGHDQPIAGIIRLISPRVDSANRSARVRITLVKGSAVAVGAFGQLVVVAREAQGLALPTSAILLGKDGAFVWQVTGTRISALPVTVRLRSASAVLVESDKLTTDLQIVVRAGHLLKEGDTITPIGEKP